MKINFFIADEIRPESSGKQTILGLFADNTIVIESQNPPPIIAANLPTGIDRLAFMINVSDSPDEKHSYKAKIIDPSGKNHGPEMQFGETVLGMNSSRTIIVEAKPFIFSGKGTYYFNFYVDGNLHSFPFKVVDREEVKATV